MNIELPLEIWASLLGFLPRPYLGEIVHRVGNRQFATIIQFVLHKYGQVKLGDLFIGEGGTAFRKRGRFDWIPVEPLDADPANEMPKNINDFGAILLRHFDKTMILGWLQKFADRHLFSNVHLHLEDYTPIDILFTLLPLLDSIESVHIKDQLILDQICTHIDEQQSGGNSSAIGWLARARILQICLVSAVPLENGAQHHDRICEWLNTAPHPNGPRLLLLCFAGYSYVNCLLKRVEKDFNDAVECASYFIYFYLPTWQRTSVQFKTLHNTRTKEIFSIEEADNDRLLISRLPEKADPDWIEEKEEEVMEWIYLEKSRRIELDVRSLFIAEKHT